MAVSAGPGPVPQRTAVTKSIPRPPKTLIVTSAIRIPRKWLSVNGFQNPNRHKTPLIANFCPGSATGINDPRETVLIATLAIGNRRNSPGISHLKISNRHKTRRSRPELLLATSHSPLAPASQPRRREENTTQWIKRLLIANFAIRNSSQVVENKRDSKILIANFHPSAATALKDRRKSVLIHTTGIRNHRKSLETKEGHESNQHKKRACD